MNQITNIMEDILKSSKEEANLKNTADRIYFRLKKFLINKNAAGRIFFPLKKYKKIKNTADRIFFSLEKCLENKWKN